MIRKQKTFESKYRENYPAIKAGEWILNLSQVFFIKSAEMVSYKRKDGFYCTRVNVKFY